jgi:hypothetical protein
MQFITRKLYQKMQPGSRVSERLAERWWERASAAQQRHFQAIESQLPESMRQFAAVSLHDGRIEKVDHLTPGEVHFEIDGSDCWGPTGQFALTFQGVKSAEGLDKVVGRYWLYEEVDVSPEAGFKFSVLLDRHEFSIVADEVVFAVVSEPDNDEEDEE